MAGEVFTSEERTLIEQWRREANAKGVTTPGAFEDFYLNVRGLIETKIYEEVAEDTVTLMAIPQLRSDADPEVVKTYEWLLGASQVNRGVGIFGTLIREYASANGAQPVSPRRRLACRSAR